jgi:hypothetical protein
VLRAVGVLAVLVAAGVWVTIARHDDVGRVPRNSIIAALDRANASSTQAHNQISTHSCAASSSTLVVCGNPSPDIDTATFRTFDTLPDLYRAYEMKAASLAGKRFSTIENTTDCNRVSRSGERSWNHNFQHPDTFSVQDLIDANLDMTTEAAGRVFCEPDGDGPGWTIVWTDNHSKLMGTVHGPLHEGVWIWWRRVHHNLNVEAPMSTGHSMN